MIIFIHFQYITQCKSKIIIRLQYIHLPYIDMQNASPQNTRYISYRHLLYITINICLSSFSYGFCCSYFNSIFGIGQESRSTMQGILTGCIAFTGGLGAFWSSILIKRFSRRQCFQVLSTAMIIVCCFLQIADLRVLLVARCVQGIIAGMITAVSPMYIRQFSPTELSSSLCPWNQIGIVSGITFSFILTFVFSFFLPASIYWRIVYAFPIFTSLTQLYNLKYNFPYETPKYLLMNNKKQQTKELLAVIYKKQYVEEVYAELDKLLNSSAAKNDRLSESGSVTEQDFPMINRSEQQKQNNTSQTHQLQSMNNNNKNLSQNLLPPVANKPKKQKQPQQLQTNKLALFTAFNLSISQQMIGMGAIIAFSGEIVGQIFPIMEKVFPIFINMIAITGAFLCIPVLKFLGRKRNLQYGTLALGLLLMFLGYCFSTIDYSNFSQIAYSKKLLVCIILLTIRFTTSITLGPVVWIYIAEIVQPDWLPYTTMINWITMALVNTIFPIAKHALGGNPHWIFMTYGIYTFLVYWVNRVVIVQTQGKSEYQIIQEFDQKLKKYGA